jgi:hypothetical protein
MPFFKCILEAVFCEGVQHGLRFYSDHLSCGKMANFQSWKEEEDAGVQVRRVEWVGYNSYVLFGQNLSVEKERGETLRCRDATAKFLSPKFVANSSHIFMQSP